LKIKDQEYKQLEKQLDLERQKMTPLLKQLDELSALNTQLTMQNADAKRRLISLELVSSVISAVIIDLYQELELILLILVD
jgi:hypothetical protein